MTVHTWLRHSCHLDNSRTSLNGRKYRLLVLAHQSRGDRSSDDLLLSPPSLLRRHPLHPIHQEVFTEPAAAGFPGFALAFVRNFKFGIAHWSAGNSASTGWGSWRTVGSRNARSRSRAPLMHFPDSIRQGEGDLRYESSPEQREMPRRPPSLLKILQHREIIQIWS
jgi:hypothetical protein